MPNDWVWTVAFVWVDAHLCYFLLFRNGNSIKTRRHFCLGFAVRSSETGFTKKKRARLEIMIASRALRKKTGE